MTCRSDVEKRREWEERFVRFRASGLTVARFCAGEPVSKNTFYCWAKRLGQRAVAARSAGRRVATVRQADAARRAGESAATANSPLVHFRLNATTEISVPADCLDVIRCLVRSVQSSRAERSEAFHEVVVGTR